MTNTIQYLFFGYLFIFPIFINAQHSTSELEKLNLEELDSFCVLYRNNGDYEKSILYGQKRADLANSLGMDSLYAEGLNNLAVLNFQAGNYDNVIPLGKQALEIRKKYLGEWHPLYAINLNNLATFYWVLGKFENVEELYLQALKIQRRAVGEEHPDYALCLNNLSNLYSKLGNYDQAAICQEKCVAIYKKVLGVEHRDYAVSIDVLGKLYRTLGKYEQAESLVEEALEIRKKALGVEHESYTKSLVSLGQIRQALGKYRQAEDLYSEALESYKKSLGTEHPDYIYCLQNLASIYEATDRNDLAADMYKKTIAIHAKMFGTTHSNYSNSLDKLANLYYDIKKYEQAKTLWMEIFTIRKNAFGEEHPDCMETLNNLAKLHQTTANYALSADYYLAAMKANCKNCDSTKISDLSKIASNEFYSNKHILETLMGWNRLFEVRNQLSGDKKLLDSAYFAVQAAIQINERIRKEFSGEKDKLRSLSQLSNLLSLSIATGLKIDDESKTNELFSFAELNKSILLADAAKAQRARAMGDLPDSLALEEINLQEQYDKLKKQETDARTAEDKNKIAASKNELTLKIEQFRKEIKNKFPKYHALKYENITAKAVDIQALLDEKSLFLEYFVSDSLVYLFALTQKEIKLITLPHDKKEINKQIKALRLALTDYELINKDEKKAYTNYITSASWAYKNLLKPALINPSINSLIIITDGELGHIPFETFLTTEVKDHKKYSELPYVLNDYKVSYNYSATLWKENRETTATNKQGTKSAQMLAAAASYKTIDEKSEVRANRSPQLINLRDALQDLPAAKEEVAALSKLFAGTFLQENATNESFFKANAGDYNIIHLAMHGLLNERAPILSSLAFTENGDSLEDNFLEAWEIAHLKLNAELVVLSACETGYGKFQQGEGVMSLARSFMYAGVPSLVVSLWQVNDGSTSAIMQAFYKNLAKGMDKAEALRQAKLEYIKMAGGVGDGRYGRSVSTITNTIAAHPAFWAPFIQLGDSQPITVETKGPSSQLWWLVGAGGLLVLAGGAGSLLKRKKMA